MVRLGPQLLEASLGPPLVGWVPVNQLLSLNLTYHTGLLGKDRTSMNNAELL